MNKEWKDKIRKMLLASHGNLFSRENIGSRDLNPVISRMLDDIAHQQHLDLSLADKAKITEELVNELTGYGPIEDLIEDPNVTEIMINGPKKIYIEKSGKKMLTNLSFDDDNQIMALIYKIISSTRRHVDEFSPYTDVAMEDGSRVNIIIPPLAIDGPIVTIRKFLKKINSTGDLVKLGTLDKRMGDFLEAAIKARANIIFSGATGCGKTTALNVLSSYISNDERIVTIEDTAELHLGQEHVVRLEARQSNIEGKGEVSLRDLFRNSLRMRPDRIILGEIRGAEALDMLQAICSGHTGSLAIIHANSPEDVLNRLETMILTSGVPIGIEAIHRQIANSINLIVQEEQLLDGSRKITYISQVNGLKDSRAVLEDIFVYDHKGIDSEGKVKGNWRSTGVVPVFYDLFKKSGIHLAEELFKKD